MNKFDLKKKVAIVTGGAQGFGLDITKRFLKSGAKVIIWDNDENELKKIVKKIKHKNLYKQMVDVTDPENVEDAVSKITKNMKEFTNHRKNTQPSALYNAGSVFKNGEDYYAAELIENAGLKGYKIDGVRVSEKHSNFFIADKDAKSSALYKLVNFVKDSIFDKYDVMLQEEIIFVGDFS